jgi:hypothetical protein
MNIAIDFDNTLTADAILWMDFLRSARNLDHNCYCVTARSDTEENRSEIEEWMYDNDITLPVFYTSLRSKTEYMKDRGIKVDIWIDDDPKTLVNGH